MSDMSSVRPRMGEIKMYENSKEREHLERLADLYSIIKATDLLEAAYSRDAITPAEYTDACNRLISQFKATEKGLTLSKTIANADQFFQEYQIDCPRAYERLVVSGMLSSIFYINNKLKLYKSCFIVAIGVPATVMHPTSDTRADTVIVAETVQAFITTMDALELGQRAVDEIHPQFSDLVAALARVRTLPADFEGLEKMKNWLQRLNAMRAADNIDDNDARQLLFDIQSTYAAFHKHLGGK